MQFDWDPQKARRNLSKHGISFDEAVTALLDDFSLTGSDPDHSREEDRYITFGVSSSGRLLVVVHTDRVGQIRIISARLATPSERRLYEEG